MAPRTNRRASISDIDAQIIELQNRRKELMGKQAERLGRIAMAAGLADLDIDDSELKAAFGEIAARFRGRTPKPGQPVNSTEPAN